ncbi:MAG: RNA methyltransferase [Flavobacteriaceae bacterium]|jgi:tRNA G18 (ribose-2'-O)-methylase SpoU|nr:MAG: RNA methyltransferase [Flavobacteriaceae bacterium]|tara:strand:- start:339 stop:869 length:531 start_codon:yes stop_codon:yes gene_type:complete
MKKLKNSELNRIDVKSFKSIKKTPLIVVLDNIRSLNNIGSIFRTCDAFLVSKIYLCGITAKPPNRKINKTALGSTDSVEWEYFKSTIKLIEKLKSEGVKIWSIEQVERAQKLNYIEKIDSKLKHAIVFGNEIKGVDQKIIDISENTIEIDQYGTKHSLNVSVAAGIVIWKFYNSLS